MDLTGFSNQQTTFNDETSLQSVSCGTKWLCSSCSKEVSSNSCQPFLPPPARAEIKRVSNPRYGRLVDDAVKDPSYTPGSERKQATTKGKPRRSGEERPTSSAKTRPTPQGLLPSSKLVVGKRRRAMIESDTDSDDEPLSVTKRRVATAAAAKRPTAPATTAMSRRRLGFDPADHPSPADDDDNVPLACILKRMRGEKQAPPSVAPIVATPVSSSPDPGAGEEEEESFPNLNILE